MTAVLAAVLAVSAAATQAPASIIPGDSGVVFDAAGVQTSSGNGRLAVSANAYGGITVCRWPTPSYYNHIRYAAYRSGTVSRKTDPRGLTWGIRRNDEVLWLTGDPWIPSTRYLERAPSITETLLTLPGTPVISRITSFVCPDKDVLVTHMSVYGAGEPTQFYWRAEISPCARLIPEAPWLDGLIDSGHGFATFFDDTSSTIYQFRPRNPGAKDWEHVRRLVSTGAASAEWASFGDGVWIGYRGLDPFSEYWLTESGPTDAQALATDRGDTNGPRSVVGQYKSVVAWDIRKTTAGESAQTVIIGFGRSLNETRDLLNSVASTGYPALLEDCRRYWTTWLERARLPATPDPVIQEVGRQCLVVLANNMDRDSGAVVRAPLPQPVAALDWARDSAWITLAFDLANYPELAEKHSLYYVGCLRKTSVPGKPSGSLPAASYTNHVDGLPHVVLDVEASAWMVWAIWRHANVLDKDARLEYLKKSWDAINLAGDFLTGWVDDRSGTPLPSFTYNLWRDGRTDGQLAGMLAGIDAAIHIAEYLGKERPAWIAQLHQLKAAAEYQWLDSARNWKVDNPLRFWPAELMSLEDSRWDAPITAALKTLPEIEPEKAAPLLCNLAMVCKAQPQWIERVQAAARVTVRNAVTAKSGAGGDRPLFPDSLAAAQWLIAIEALFGQ